MRARFRGGQLLLSETDCIFGADGVVGEVRWAEQVGQTSPLIKVYGDPLAEHQLYLA